MPVASKSVTDIELPEVTSKPKFSAFWKFGLHNQSTFSIEASDIEVFGRAVSDMQESGGLEVLVDIGKALADYTKEKFTPADGVDLIKSELGGKVVSDTTQSGKQCAHGWMVYKTGEKNGKSWAAYMCPAPKGDPNQCKPVWA